MFYKKDIENQERMSDFRRDLGYIVGDLMAQIFIGVCVGMAVGLVSVLIVFILTTKEWM